MSTLDPKELGKASAMADQIGATLRDTFAPALGSYYRSLIDQGIPETAATELVARMQGVMLDMVRAQMGKGGG